MSTIWDALAAAAIGLLLGGLILAGSEKQSAHVIQGVLFRGGRDAAYAEVIFSRHRPWPAYLAWSLGFALGAAAISFFVDGSRLSAPTALVAFLLAGGGVAGLMRSFRRAHLEAQAYVAGPSAGKKRKATRPASTSASTTPEQAA
ncbi:MAG: hypothetical protein Q8J89_15940 [Caulobacter sp.]|nr:hypothetical protein [Caulobacter sp.]